MTDQEETIAFLTKMKIEHEVRKSKENYGVEIMALDNFEKTTFDTSIIIEQGFGYMGFYCELFFLDGKIQGHGCYE